MNQSTTQLGSKRQSQGKHLYPAIDIFICCAVIVCQVSKYFYVSSFFSVFVIFGARFILFISLLVYFHQDGFLACGHLALWVSFVLSLCEAQVCCMSSCGHTMCHLVDFH